jgi:hypothetical protein
MRTTSRKLVLLLPILIHLRLLNDSRIIPRYLIKFLGHAAILTFLH